MLEKTGERSKPGCGSIPNAQLKQRFISSGFQAGEGGIEAGLRIRSEEHSSILRVGDQAEDVVTGNDQDYELTRVFSRKKGSLGCTWTQEMTSSRHDVGTSSLINFLGEHLPGQSRTGRGPGPAGDGQGRGRARALVAGVRESSVIRTAHTQSLRSVQVL